LEDWEKREKELLRHLLSKSDMDLKIQCHLIELLVRRTPNGGKELLDIDPDWVAKKLRQMKDGSVGPAIGKCLVSVLMALRTDLLEEDEKVQAVL
jgi:hypothetical protein